MCRVGISKSDQTSLARLCDAHIAMGDLAEACPHNLAPTASTTAMLALGDALVAPSWPGGEISNWTIFIVTIRGGCWSPGLRSVMEAIRFKVGSNLPVVPDSVTVCEACELCEPRGRTTGWSRIFCGWGGEAVRHLHRWRPSATCSGGRGWIGSADFNGDDGPAAASHRG